MLAIQNGGTLTVFGAGTVGNLPGGVGTVMVTGPGSKWQNNGTMVVGGQGEGTVTVQNGGSVNSAGVSIGLAPESRGTVTVTGPNSVWTNGTCCGLNIGAFGTGTLVIANGGRFINITPNAANIGEHVGSNGTVVVTGVGSIWRNTLPVNLGDSGTGTLTIADSGVVEGPIAIARNAGATGTLNFGAGTGDPAVAPGTITTSNLVFGAGTGTLNFNHTSANYQFAPAISGNGTVNVLAGTTTLTGANMYGGATNVTSGTLRAGALNTFSPNSAVTVGSGGTLDLAGFDQTIPGLINQGTVRTGGSPGAGAGTVLTVAGNYTAASTLELNTFLGADGSPSDRLLIINGGTATGTTNLLVNNTVGPGALTAGDGILVVDTAGGGTTAPGAFIAGAPIVAGPYQYTLERGSVTGGNAQAWFLRSAIDCALVPSLPDCVGPPGPIPVPPTPNYRPQVSLYTAIPPMAAIYGRHVIGTLHERVGEEEQLKGRTDLRESPNFNGAWGRVIGQWGHADGDALGIYSGGPEYDYGFGALQLGMDVYGKEYENGVRDHAGLYAAIGHGEVDVTHNQRGRSSDAGSNDFDAFTAGGYWTRFWENNAYLDGVVQGTWYGVTSESQRNTLLGFPDQQIDGFGFAASLEGGYPFYFGDGWQIEPQAQLIYQAINFDTFNDGAADVRFDDVSSLPGRIGARIARTWTVEEASGDEPARLATVWGRVNFWHNFLDSDVTTSFSSASGFIPFTAQVEDSWIEAGLGGTLELTPTASLYGNVNFATSYDGDAYGIGGKLGLRMNW